MFAVVIVGIVTALAIPAYSTYIQRARESAAQQFVLDVANAEKQYFLDARRYLAIADNNFSPLGGLPFPDEVSRYYDVVVTTTPTTFDITATGKEHTTQFGKDQTLDSAGNKSW
jgi:type IV pilus assembly protein PilE